MKKLFIAILAVCIAISLAGCDENKGKSDNVQSDQTQTELQSEKESETLSIKAEETEKKESAAENETVTQKETEEVTGAKTEESTGRESDVVKPPLTEPAEESYFNIYKAVTPDEYAGLPNYVIYESEYATPIIFESVGVNTDFTVCALEMTKGYDEIGECVISNLSFDNQNKIVVMLDFPGDMSSWYFSYLNARGEKCEYQLYISGMDDSLICTEWNQ
ncbi:MAG: hypothetical protein IKU52_03675 [Clostridia bacterium]|nr:hypothetical protein [Clostridia bacterium]